VGRKISDAEAVDVTVPDTEEVEKGELYRIEGFTGFAMVAVADDATERQVALETTHSCWRVKVPSGTCGTRGMYVKWASGGPNGTAFAFGGDDLADETSGARTVNSIAKVEYVRNSNGYATLRLLLV
jgi:hypothetical protein